MRADQLLEAIYDAPHDDALRANYAEWLTARGELRGEAIALQLERARAKAVGAKVPRASAAREKELLQTHERAWLGELAPVVLKTGCKFERGFLDACEVKAKTSDQLEAVIGNAAWSTVRSITAAGMSFKLHPLVDNLLLDPVMRSLRVLDGDHPSTLLRALFLGSVERPLHTFRFGHLQMSPGMSWRIDRGWTVLPPNGPEFPKEDMLALRDCSGLPNLRDLDITGAYHRCPPRFLRWFLDGALSQRLERLTIRTGEEIIPEWIEALADHPLPELVIKGEDLDGTYVLRKGDAPRSTHLAVSLKKCNWPHCYRGSEPISPFNAMLRMLEHCASGARPPIRFSRLEIHWSSREAPSDEQRSSLERVLGRLDVGSLSAPLLRS